MSKYKYQKYIPLTSEVVKGVTTSDGRNDHADDSLNEASEFENYLAWVSQDPLVSVGFFKLPEEPEEVNKRDNDSCDSVDDAEDWRNK